MKITYETKIDAPVERVWELLNDFGNVQNFHPLVLESHSLSNLAGGTGAERRCDFGKGVALYERIVDVSDGTSMEVEIYKLEGMPKPVRSTKVHFELEPSGSGTRVVGTIEPLITAKIAAMLMGPIMKRQLTKGWRQLLAGLKKHAETSELINLDSPIDVDAVLAVA